MNEFRHTMSTTTTSRASSPLPPSPTTTTTVSPPQQGKRMSSLTRFAIIFPTILGVFILGSLVATFALRMRRRKQAAAAAAAAEARERSPLPYGDERSDGLHVLDAQRGNGVGTETDSDPYSLAHQQGLVRTPPPTAATMAMTVVTDGSSTYSTNNRGHRPQFVSGIALDALTETEKREILLGHLVERQGGPRWQPYQRPPLELPATTSDEDGNANRSEGAQEWHEDHTVGDTTVFSEPITRHEDETHYEHGNGQSTVVISFTQEEDGDGSAEAHNEGGVNLHHLSSHQLQQMLPLAEVLPPAEPTVAGRRSHRRDMHVRR